jgi:hypothetical protein
MFNYVFAPPYFKIDKYYFHIFVLIFRETPFLKFPVRVKFIDFVSPFHAPHAPPAAPFTQGA